MLPKCYLLDLVSKSTLLISHGVKAPINIQESYEYRIAGNFRRLDEVENLLKIKFHFQSLDDSVHTYVHVHTHKQWLVTPIASMQKHVHFGSRADIGKLTEGLK